MKVIYLWLFLGVCAGLGYLMSNKQSQPLAKQQTKSGSQRPATTTKQPQQPHQTFAKPIAKDDLHLGVHDEIQRLDVVIKLAENRIVELEKQKNQEAARTTELAKTAAEINPGWMGDSIRMTDSFDRVAKLQDQIFEQQDRIDAARSRQDRLRANATTHLPKVVKPSESHQQEQSTPAYKWTFPAEPVQTWQLPAQEQPTVFPLGKKLI